MAPTKGEPHVTRVSSIVRTSVAVLAIGLLTGAAEAGGFHGSGGVRVSGGFRASGGVRVSGGFRAAPGGVRVGSGGPARAWGPTWGGRVWVGGYRPYPYYYRPYYYPVPAYYGAEYPVDVIAAPGITEVVVPPPPLLRFGFGLFGGGVVTTNTTSNGTSVDTQSGDFGLLARFRLTTGLILEGEVGKTRALTATSVNGFDSTRVDRRVGASLVYEFGAYNRWAPYIVGGLGVERTDANGFASTTRGYGEIGGGIRFALSEHFHITADLRVGSREATSTADNPTVIARTIYPTPTTTVDAQETYVRSRLAAILWF